MSEITRSHAEEGAATRDRTLEDFACELNRPRADSVYEPVSELPLIAFACDSLRPVARARTDCFGAFELKLDQRGRYALALGESTRAPCILLWEGPP